MKPTDMRSLPPQARRARRMEVVKLRSAGRTDGEVAEQTGLSRTGVANIWRRFRESGAVALNDQLRKPSPNGPANRTLSLAQCTAIRELITDQLPDRLSLPYTLWTKAAVVQLVNQHFGVAISVRNTALHLARWGFKPHPPVNKSSACTSLATARWLSDVYPGIKTQAGSEDAEICWADVSLLSSDDGQAAAGCSVFSTVNNKGQMHWAVFAGALDAATFIDCLRRRVQDASKKILLIVDTLPVRYEAAVVDWLAEQEDAIEVFELPVRPSLPVPLD